eukprot:TRINITY_DN31908_c0_g1_i1.p1 TRINITY_DN31908_c0_g1~~TRINITY_DN31908_c0_g1_i1.p1  ORF type:complete len:224 (+),score=51.75 TRINITY_DN31908_c0_g1_i1:64-735(+)
MCIRDRYQRRVHGDLSERCEGYGQEFKEYFEGSLFREVIALKVEKELRRKIMSQREQILANRELLAELKRRFLNLINKVETKKDGVSLRDSSDKKVTAQLLEVNDCLRKQLTENTKITEQLKNKLDELCKTKENSREERIDLIANDNAKPSDRESLNPQVAEEMRMHQDLIKIKEAMNKQKIKLHKRGNWWMCIAAFELLIIIALAAVLYYAIKRFDLVDKIL